MKLIRYGKLGSEKPGIVDSEGKIRDLSNVLADIDAGTLSDDSLNNIRKTDLRKLPEANNIERIGCPVANVGKLICIGLNYSDHAKESNMPIPTEPVVFMKATSAIIGPNDDVLLPAGSKKGDWEVELAVVIGKQLGTYLSQTRWNMSLDTRSAMMCLKENGNLSTEVNGQKEKASTRSRLLVHGWLLRMKLKILINFPCGWISTERGCRLGTRIP